MRSWCLELAIFDVYIDTQICVGLENSFLALRRVF